MVPAVLLLPVLLVGAGGLERVAGGLFFGLWGEGRGLVVGLRREEGRKGWTDIVGTVPKH